MDIKQEIRRLVPAGALGLFGLESTVAEPIGDADLTILFTDLDGHTALTERLGDSASHDLVRAHDRIVRDALAATGGREIKHTGDGIMASFRSASRGVQAATLIQRGAAAWNRDGQRSAELRIAAGLNSGAPIVEAGDLFGTAVILAARIADDADGGQVLASEVVRLLAAGKGFRFEPREPRALEGLAEPVPLYEVVWQEEAAASGSVAA
jgi:adenylate cyclase